MSTYPITIEIELRDHIDAYLIGRMAGLLDTDVRTNPELIGEFANKEEALERITDFLVRIKGQIKHAH